MNYIVLIADIVESKSIENRDQFQSNLRKKLKQINKSSYSIVSPFTITLGDEFQAVYKNYSNIFSDIFKLTEEIYPVQVRFAISYGDISTEINPKHSIGMDGPAFYDARKGMEELKRIDYSIVQFYGDVFTFEKFINRSLKLSFSVMANWKENTLRIFKELYRNKSVKEIAPLLNITERGVYKIIDTNNVRNFVEYFNSLGQTILAGKEQ